MQRDEIKIREIETFDEMDRCLELQRKVFSFNDLDVSPRRHLVVTKQSGGFTLGAFTGEELVGLTITVPAFRGEERGFYSHMAAVLPEYQSFGIGGRMKWAQREIALSKNVKFIKWTFQPAQARNAFFNLEKLGAVIRQYVPNFYGTGFTSIGARSELESDRVYGEWELESDKVVALAKGESYQESGEILKEIEIPHDWNSLLLSDGKAAESEQNRIKEEFRIAFSSGLVCRGFRRGKDRPAYLFYKAE